MSDKNKNLEDSILESAVEFEEVSPVTDPVTEELDISSKEFTTEIENEEKYGDSPLEAGALSAASELSFGLSDQALIKLGYYTAEELKELRARNRAASVTGSVAGIAAPLVASGGTSALAKGVSKAGTGVIAASKAGDLATKAASKILKESAKDKFVKSAVKKSISQGLGSAVEATPYAISQTLKEDALGTADFNAENLLSNLGTAAAFSGVAGGVFGTAQALVPVIKNNKVVDYVQKKVKNLGDADKATWELTNKTPLKTMRLKESRPEVFKNGKKFLVEDVKLTKKDSPLQLYKKIDDATQANGKKIGDTVDAIDKYAKQSKLTIMPSKREWADDMIIKMKGSLDKDSLSITSKRQNKLLSKQIKMLDEYGNKAGNITGRDMQKFKTDFYSKAKYGIRGEVSFENELNRTMGRLLRQNLNDVADKLAPINAELGDQLKKANLNYSTGVEMLEGLEKKVANDQFKKSFGSFKDFLFADVVTGVAGSAGGGLGMGAAAIAGKKFLESDFRRKAQILGSIERANKKTESKILKSVENFFNKARKISVPTSTKILLNTSYSTDKPKKSKTRKEGFKRIRQELTDLKNDPNKLIEHITKNNLRVTNSAPQAAQIIDQRMVESINFLHDKLPKPPGQNGMIQNLTRAKNYQPSTIEIAKFERYVEGVENPLSALDDLESGRLSREKIEAVRTIYPNIYQRIQLKAMEYITQNAENIPYPKRLQIGVLLDVPADSSLLPVNMMNLQKTFTPEEAATPQQISSDIDIAESEQSDVQRVSSRK